MRRLHRVLVTVLMGGACLSALAPASQAQPKKPAAPAASTANRLSDAEITARANALLIQMTPEEKAAQLSQHFYLQQYAPLNGPALKALATTGVGSLLFVSNATEINRLQKMAIEQSRLKIPVLFGFDVIHGLRTVFPVPIAMAASWDPQVPEAAQAVAAKEARAVGINWTFAPMVDLSQDVRWGRIVEGAGEDPYLGSVMAAAQVRGFQGAYLGAPGHVIAGPKHFAGYGAAMGGRDYDEVNLPESELWNVYLPPFKAAVDAGAGNIMSAYMGLNGVPSSANKWLLTTVLRDTWGFKGFVSSDAAAVLNLTTQGLTGSPKEAAAAAVKAGLDMEMAKVGNPPAMLQLPAALSEGAIDVVAVDNAVRYVLEAKIRMGLFENPYVDESKVEAVLNDPAHKALARTAAERSAVLLSNEGGVLPLDAKTVKSIALIGPLADSDQDVLGPWVFPQNGIKGTSVLEGLKAKVGKTIRIDYAEGVRSGARTFPSPFVNLIPPKVRPPIDETAEIQRAVALAKAADVAVLVLGETQDMIGESSSRASLDLPGRQQELLDAVIATGKPVAVVLLSARPLNLKAAKPGALLDVFYPGAEGGQAVANLLFGDANPGGKLPFTWIANAAHAPATYAHLGSHEPKKAAQRYWDGSNTPTYPFGFGLSYTSFQYGKPRLAQAAYKIGDTVKVSVEVKNTGARVGDEVAQLYIHQRTGTSLRPVRELKGFQRVTLKPGETKTVEFDLTPNALQYWSSATRGWVQDASAFDVWVGGASDTKNGAEFIIAGN